MNAPESSASPSRPAPALTSPRPAAGSRLILEHELLAAELPASCDPGSLGIVALSSRLSPGSLRFQIGRTDFARGAGTIPVLAFALDLRALLTGLRPEDHARQLLGRAQALHFVRIGDAVRVTGGEDGRTEMIPWAEAVETSRAFLGRVARDLLGRFPGLLENRGLVQLAVSAGETPAP